MNNLTITTANGQLVVDSREVAAMTDVRHSDLLERSMDTSFIYSTEISVQQISSLKAATRTAQGARFRVIYSRAKVVTWLPTK